MYLWFKFRARTCYEYILLFYDNLHHNPTFEWVVIAIESDPTSGYRSHAWRRSRYTSRVLSMGSICPLHTMYHVLLYASRVEENWRGKIEKLGWWLAHDCPVKIRGERWYYIERFENSVHVNGEYKNKADKKCVLFAYQSKPALGILFNDVWNTEFSSCCVADFCDRCIFGRKVPIIRNWLYKWWFHGRNGRVGYCLSKGLFCILLKSPQWDQMSHFYMNKILGQYEE